MEFEIRPRLRDVLNPGEPNLSIHRQPSTTPFKHQTMDQRRPQSRESGRGGDRPSRRAGEPSSTPPSSSSQGRDNRNQSSVEAGPSSRGRNANQGGPSQQPRPPSRTASDDEEENEGWKTHAVILKIRENLLKHNVVLPEYSDQTVQQARLWDLSQECSNCVKRRADLKRRWRRLQRRRGEIQPDRSQGALHYFNSVDDFRAEQRQMKKDEAELNAVLLDVEKRQQDLQTSAGNVQRELNERNTAERRELEAQLEQEEREQQRQRQEQQEAPAPLVDLSRCFSMSLLRLI